MPNAAEECEESAQQGEGAVGEAAASIIAWYYSRGGADPFDDEKQTRQAFIFSFINGFRKN